MKEYWYAFANKKKTFIKAANEKLDGVGPVDNRPSTDKLHHLSERRKKKEKNYMWHVTCDTWHVTRDMSHVTHSVGWTFSQNFSFLALPVWDWEDILGKGSLSYSIN